MESFLIYIGKSAIAAGAFYIAFLLLFQNRKQFVFNRFYLPVSLLLSFVIPLITFTTVKYIEPTPAPDFSSFAYLADTTEIQTPPAFEWEWYHYLFGIYLLGAAGFLFHLLLGHLKAISIIRKSRIQKLFENFVNITQKDVHPFSFFNKIVLSEKTLSHPNLDIIVNHESIHVKEKHTYDILFTEILFLVQWFNPFAWLMKDAVKNNLEYKTDHKIAKTNDPQTYQLAMLTLADKQGVAPFLTALNGSQLKNRIIMMKKKTNNKYALLKQLVVLPLLAVLIMGLSNKEVKTEILPSKEKTQNTTLRDKTITGKVFAHENEKPLEGVNIYNNMGKKITSTNQNGEFSIKTEKEKDNLIFIKQGFQPQGREVDLTNKKNTYVTTYLNIQFNIENEKEMLERIVLDYSNGDKSVGPVSHNPDEWPEFPGGESVLKKFLTDNIKYPEDALEKGIWGDAYVSFIITKEGKVIAPRISRGVDPSLDKEALRLVSSLPEWKPGKENGENVNVWYTVPVRFRIKDPRVREKKVELDLNQTTKTKQNEIKIRKDTNKRDPRINKVKGFNNDPNSLMNRWNTGEPLYIVDGKEMDSVEDLDPKLIESISVLKNASAIDLYGAKAKNGVIIICTKQPMKATSEQLYIVDGKEVSYEQMEKISPTKIASVDVLKGKTATNLYGEKAKNGVIVITTKEDDYKEPVYILDGKKVDKQEAYNHMNNQQLIKDVIRLDAEQAKKKYGPAGENGVVEIYSKKNPTTVDELFSTKSINENPLILVDGKRIVNNINQIDPVFIEKASILKGDAAKEKYGELGKNGVIEFTLKKPKELTQNEIPVVLNGKPTGKKLNEIDSDLIEHIKKIDPEEATKKYGNFGKMGVLEVTSRKLYTDNVKVKSSDEITTPLELRKFIANKIKYPVEAQEAGMTGTATALLDIDKNGKVKIGEQYPDVKLEKVVVVGYSPSVKSSKQPKKNILEKETERVAKLIKQVDIDNFKGKTVLVTVKFMLQ